MRLNDTQLDALEVKLMMAFDQKNWKEQSRYQAIIDAEKIARWNEYIERIKATADNALGQEPCAGVCARSPAPMGCASNGDTEDK